VRRLDNKLGTETDDEPSCSPRNANGKSFVVFFLPVFRLRALITSKDIRRKTKDFHFRWTCIMKAAESPRHQRVILRLLSL